MKFDYSNFDLSKFDHSKFDHSKFNHSKFDHSKFDHLKFDHLKFDHLKLARPFEVRPFEARPFEVGSFSRTLREQVVNYRWRYFATGGPVDLTSTSGLEHRKVRLNAPGSSAGSCWSASKMYFWGNNSFGVEKKMFSLC